MKKFIYFSLGFILIATVLKINDAEAKSKDFFVSLRANNVNMRTGPSIQNPIKFTYKVKDLPMQVLDEYDGWYKLKDFMGDSGWINKNLTSKRATAIVLDGTQIIFKSDSIKSKPVVRVAENTVLRIKKCKDTWCKVKIEDYTGWIEKDGIWGGIK